LLGTPFVSNVVLRTVSRMSVPLVPPTRKSPSDPATTAAPASGEGSSRSSLASAAVCQSPSAPVVEFGVRMKTEVVGLPSAPSPPIA
jgi:hypothetical protein